MTICDKPILPLGSVAPGMDLAIDGIPTYPHSHMIDSKARGQALAGSIGGSGVVLLRGHGVAVYGSSVEDATVRAIALDEVAKLNYMALTLGAPNPIPDDEIEEYMSILRAARAPSSGDAAVAATSTGDAPARTSRSVMSSWRHYCQLADEPL